MDCSLGLMCLSFSVGTYIQFWIWPYVLCRPDRSREQSTLDHFITLENIFFYFVVYGFCSDSQPLTKK